MGGHTEGLACSEEGGGEEAAVTLYRALYEWPSGRQAYITFAAKPASALAWAARFVRASCKGYLLSIHEVRPCAVQLRLVA